jgi:hypothetical protein
MGLDPEQTCLLKKICLIAFSPPTPTNPSNSALDTSIQD